MGAAFVVCTSIFAPAPYDEEHGATGAAPSCALLVVRVIGSTTCAAPAELTGQLRITVGRASSLDIS